MFLDEYPDIPYDTLKYTCGECNYGGKVTDSHDRTTLMTILDDYYTPRILDDAYKTSPSGIYCTLVRGEEKGGWGGGRGGCLLHAGEERGWGMGLGGEMGICCTLVRGDRVDCAH